MIFERKSERNNKVISKLLSGFIQVHILRHAHEGGVYGSWLIEHLQDHGYNLSPGTLYPMLKRMVTDGLLKMEQENVNGRIRKIYTTTPLGDEALQEASLKIRELSKNYRD